MGLFGKGQGTAFDAQQLSQLTARVTQLEAAVRVLERDLTDLHARFVKDKRAASAERRNQERSALSEDEPAVTPAVLPAPEAWGARARMRGTNGVHP